VGDVQCAHATAELLTTEANPRRQSAAGQGSMQSALLTSTGTDHTQKRTQRQELEGKVLLVKGAVSIARL